MDTGRPTVPSIFCIFDGMHRHIQTEAGIPSRPGEDPGVSVTFSLEIEIIGKDSRGQKRKLELMFDVVKIGWYDIYEDTEIETRYREFVEEIGPELTHNSDEWTCLGCGVPATDIVWISLYIPPLYKRCSILISSACKTCAIRMERSALRATSKTEDHNQSSPTAINTIPRPSALRDGFSGACLTCRTKPPTSGEILRCGNCKLARYCSVDCQKQDWARHKTICGTIQVVSRTDGTIQAVSREDDGGTIQTVSETSDEAKDGGSSVPTRRVSWYTRYLPKFLRWFGF